MTKAMVILIPGLIIGGMSAITIHETFTRLFEQLNNVPMF